MDSGTSTRKPNYSREFNEWWFTYPKMPRVGKQKTFLLFKEIEREQEGRVKLIEATEQYSLHILEFDRKARDPERFLKNSFWQDWLPEEEVNESTDTEVVYCNESTSERLEPREMGAIP